MQGRRPPLTGRAAILALVVCALAVSFAYPVRQYVEQRAQIQSLKDQNDDARERVEALESQKRRWQDPAYVRAQARQRLHFVLPGEVGFTTEHGGGDRAGSSEGSRLSSATTADQPWFSRLWASVEGASREGETAGGGGGSAASRP